MNWLAVLASSGGGVEIDPDPWYNGLLGLLGAIGFGLAAVIVLAGIFRLAGRRDRR